MYHSKKAREKKVQELEKNQEFMDYANKAFDAQVMLFDDEKTFEQYLLNNVFSLYDNFTLLRFMETADQETIDKAMSEALKNL